MLGFITQKTVQKKMLCLCILLTIPCVSSFDNSQIQKYLDKQSKIVNGLLNSTSYDKRFIPTLHGEALQVKMGITIPEVLKIAEMEAEMTIYIKMKWFDYRLAWNSSSHSRIKVREHFLDKIWLPDIRIVNLKDMKHFEGFGGVNMNIHSNGKVYFSQHALIKTSCPMDLHKFPVDRQTCILDFASFAYSKSLLNFSMDGKAISVGRAHGVRLPQFEFVEAKEVKEKRKSVMSHVRIALTFQRHVGYYILQIYVPSTFLVMLSWLGFFMEPTDIADRLALEITMILSIVFLLGGINTSIDHVSYPKASDWFVIISFAFIFFALLETMLVYHMAKSRMKKQNQGKQSTGLWRYLSFHANKSKKKEVPQNGLQLDDQNSNKADGELNTIFPSETQDVAVEFKPKNRKPWNLPAFIDKMSIVVFPGLYVGFNIFYWLYYYKE